MNTNGALAAIKAFKEALNGNVVSEQEVLRRTMVCAICPKLKRDTGVKTGISRMLGNLANKHRLPDEIKGKSCGVCGCSLMLLLPATDKDLHVDSPEQAKERPKSCWMITK
jgi:hypothetical protein